MIAALRSRRSLVAFVMLMISMVVVATVAFRSSPDTPRTAPHTPVCQTDNGREAPLCWHHDDRSGWILNVDHGAYSFVLDTGDVINLPR